jgi:hypothetical protein
MRAVQQSMIHSFATFGNQTLFPSESRLMSHAVGVISAESDFAEHD